MGFLRFYLAICVLLYHVELTWCGVGGRAAVEAFFVLSGLYMAAVYTTKYSLVADGAKVFYLNRFLRLYPTYLFLVALTFACFLAMRVTGDGYSNRIFDLFDHTGALSVLQQVMIWVSSLTLVGQDFLSLNRDVHNMLPVPPGWSISTELLFYLSVPFLFRHATWKICFAMAAALFVAKAGLTAWDKWFAYVFPITNFAYFFLGYGLYGLITHPRADVWKAKLGNYRFLIILLAVVELSRMGEASFGVHPLRNMIMVLCVGLLAWLLFERTPRAIDQFLGNISYGVYLNHFLLMVWGQMMGLGGMYLVVWSVVSSVTLAFLIEKVIQEPVDRYRRSFTTRAA